MNSRQLLYQILLSFSLLLSFWMFVPVHSVAWRKNVGYWMKVDISHSSVAQLVHFAQRVRIHEKLFQEIYLEKYMCYRA